MEQSADFGLGPIPLGGLKYEQGQEARARQYDVAKECQQEYLDRVALEAMKVLLAAIPGAHAHSLAKESHEIARAMLKARSQGGAE